MTVIDFQDLPLADREREWDGDEPNERYRKAFVWFDSDKPQNFGSYKLQIADVVDGKLKAAPRAVMSAAGVMQGARGGADLPRGDIDDVKSHLARYYKKMGETPPWEDS